MSYFTLPPRRQIAYWLLGSCAMVFVILIVGGITRLTQSGLSITEWEPIRGLIPPLSQEDWDHYFEAYRASPEYQKLNRGLPLEEFKGIFWWEYIHRVVARIFGLGLLLPAAYFAFRGWLRRWDGVRMLVLLGLVFLQALLGWAMVQTGLGDHPHVSHYHLAAHLGMALGLFGFMMWWAFRLLHDSSSPGGEGAPSWLYRCSVAITALIFVQCIWGAFVAGLDAGRLYNTFPRMGEHWMAPAVGELTPLWVDLTANPVTVQLVHRLLGMALVIATLLLWLGFASSGAARSLKKYAAILFALTALQMLLGIATLLLEVPITTAVIHQAMGLLLFGVALRLAFCSSTCAGFQTLGDSPCRPIGQSHDGDLRIDAGGPR